MNQHSKYLVIKSLAAETRYKIMDVFAKHTQIPVYRIAEELGMTHSAISHQLRVLEAAMIIESKRAGREQIYKISNTPEASFARKIMRA